MENVTRASNTLVKHRCLMIKTLHVPHLGNTPTGIKTIDT